MASGSGESQKQPSAACVDAVSEGLANLNMTGVEDFTRLLECPICIEILAAPIHQCQRGHTICNTCKPKLTKCPSCEAPIIDTRNLALESILRTLSFSCSYHLKGCNEALKIQDLQEHHEECGFRPLKCHLSDQDNCNGTLLCLADTLRHLRDIHKLRTSRSIMRHPNRFLSVNRLCLPVATKESNDKRPLTWPGELFHFDGNDFLALIRKDTKAGFAFFGFYLIGSKSDATKYVVKITIQKSPLALREAVWKHEVTTRFTSIRCFQKEWEENKLPGEDVIQTDAMCRDTTITVKGNNQTRPTWDLIYEINKI